MVHHLPTPTPADAPVAESSKKRKRRDYRDREKEKKLARKQDKVDEFKELHKEVKFGDVVQAPPTFTALPKEKLKMKPVPKKELEASRKLDAALLMKKQQRAKQSMAKKQHLSTTREQAIHLYRQQKTRP
jgi:hypothetical protein